MLRTRLRSQAPRIGIKSDKLSSFGGKQTPGAQRHAAIEKAMNQKGAQILTLEAAQKFKHDNGQKISREMTLAQHMMLQQSAVFIQDDGTANKLRIAPQKGGNQGRSVALNDIAFEFRAVGAPPNARWQRLPRELPPELDIIVVNAPREQVFVPQAGTDVAGGIKDLLNKENKDVFLSYIHGGIHENDPDRMRTIQVFDARNVTLEDGSKQVAFMTTQSGTPNGVQWETLDAKLSNCMVQFRTDPVEKAADKRGGRRGERRGPAARARRRTDAHGVRRVGGEGIEAGAGLSACGRDAPTGAETGGAARYFVVGFSGFLPVPLIFSVRPTVISSSSGLWK